MKRAPRFLSVGAPNFDGFAAELRGVLVKKDLSIDGVDSYPPSGIVRHVDPKVRVVVSFAGAKREWFFG